jgi:uncharacterized membrane protein YphA (DoxX/SURF4 family)
MNAAKPAGWPIIGLWVLRGLVALLFVATGIFKLSAAPMAVQEFNQIGFGQGFRIFTGLTEIVGAAMLLTPAVSSLGAALLFCVSVGALVAQANRLHQDVIHALVLMAITATLGWASRRSWTVWRPRLIS